MPFLSSAQFILVLWLLVAAAPVATVLLNGSVAVFAPVAEVARTAQERVAEKEDDEVSVESRPAQAHTAAFPCPISIFASAEVAAGELPSASVLHTALQRHRPRVA